MCLRVFTGIQKYKFEHVYTKNHPCNIRYMIDSSLYYFFMYKLFNINKKDLLFVMYKIGGKPSLILQGSIDL